MRFGSHAVLPEPSSRTGQGPGSGTLKKISGIRSFIDFTTNRQGKLRSKALHRV